MAGAPEVFVYYRIAAADEAALLRHVAVFQRKLCERFGGLQARLLRRHGQARDAVLLTMMETYCFAGPPDATSPIDTGDLLAAIDQAATAIGPLIHGGRHVEVFETCA